MLIEVMIMVTLSITIISFAIPFPPYSHDQKTKKSLQLQMIWGAHLSIWMREAILLNKSDKSIEYENDSVENSHPLWQLCRSSMWSGAAEEASWVRQEFSCCCSLPCQMHQVYTTGHPGISGMDQKLPCKTCIVENTQIATPFLGGLGELRQLKKYYFAQQPETETCT